MRGAVISRAAANVTVASPAEPMKQSQRLVKNVLAGGFSTAAGGLMQLAAVVMIARWLTLAQFGTYAFMVSLAFILQRLVDMGISSILMRDLAVAPQRTAELLGGALSFAWTVCSAIVLLFFAVIFLLPFPRTASVLTAIMAIGGLTQFHCGCYGSVLLAHEDNELQALGFILHKVVLIAGVFVALEAGTGLAGVVVAHLVSSVFQWLFYRWIVIGRYALPRLAWNPLLWKSILVSSIPIGAASVMRLLAEQVDIMILTGMTDLRAVGLFSGPYRMVAGLRFLPQAMVIALFPLYSRTATVDGSKAEFLEIYERGIRGFLLLALPMGLVFICAPVTLTTGLLGMRYLPAAPAMRLLGIMVWLIFIGSPFPFMLTALDDQRFLFVSAAAAFLLRTALDFALTPHLSFLAPCWAAMISESLLLTLWIGRLHRSGLSLPLGKILWRPCLTGAIMAVILHAFASRGLLLLIPVVIVCFAIYLLLLIKLGAISAQEWEMGREGMHFLRPFLAQWSRQERSEV